MAFENEIRNASIIERWGIVRMHRRPTMGEHSHRVAIYADQIAQILNLSPLTRYEIVVLALWHDMPEEFTGDIQGPLKSSRAINRDQLVQVETLGMLTRYGTIGPQLIHHPVPMVRGVVKVADMLDELLDMVIEKRMGNQLITDDMYNGTATRMWEAVRDLDLMDERQLDNLYVALADAITSHTTGVMHREHRKPTR